MKAIVCTKYGSPEVLKISEIDKPILNEDEVLVKVNATAATASDTFIRALKVPGGHGFPVEQLMKFAMRIFIGFNRPYNPVLGLVFSGVIESVGKNIKAFKEGDEVFGLTGQSRGSYAEYKCVSDKEIASGEIALKPKNISHEDAAAIVYGGILVMHFMKAVDIKKGQKVMIYGASGAIGTIAVQLVRYLGAEITGVCSSGNFEMVKSLGASKVLDYNKKDASKQLEKYDYIFDAVGKNKSSQLKDQCKNSLIKGGNYVSVDDGFLKIEPGYLKKLNELIENNHIEAVIDKRFRLEEIVEAHKYVDKGHKKGNVVIHVSE